MTFPIVRSVSTVQYHAHQALTANPYRTTHFMWLAHESMLESVMRRMPRLIKRDQQAMVRDLLEKYMLFCVWCFCLT